MILPLPFTYRLADGLEVAEKTKEWLEQSGELARLSRLSWAYHSVGDLIPQTKESFWSGHFFPWTESWQELQISYELATVGLYKQAMATLRSGLELSLLSVYWNLNDDGHEVIQTWLKSGEDTPRFGEVWKKLEKHPNFQLFSLHYNIKGRLLALRYLHNYVHSKGSRYSNSFGLMTSNTQSFEKKALKVWLKAFREVIEILTILHLVKYPLGIVRFEYSDKFAIDTPMFGGIDPHEVEWLKDVVGPLVFKKLEIVAGQDERVQEILSWVTSLPDMTEEEREEQIIELDKTMIRGMGFEKWLEQEKKPLSVLRDRERVEKRIAILTAWAEENGLTGKESAN